MNNDNWADEQRRKAETLRRDELMRGFHERMVCAMASPCAGMTAVRLASVTQPR
jgi:hypothetical protein